MQAGAGMDRSFTQNIKDYCHLLLLLLNIVIITIIIIITIIFINALNY